MPVPGDFWNGAAAAPGLSRHLATVGHCRGRAHGVSAMIRAVKSFYREEVP